MYNWFESFALSRRNRVLSLVSGEIEEYAAHHSASLLSVPEKLDLRLMRGQERLATALRAEGRWDGR